jgi:hypothetical protein
LFPTLVGYVSEGLPLGATIAVFSAFASGLMIVMLMLLPETRGRNLADLERPAPAALSRESIAVGRGSD